MKNSIRFPVALSPLGELYLKLGSMRPSERRSWLGRAKGGGNRWKRRSDHPEFTEIANLIDKLHVAGMSKRHINGVLYTKYAGGGKWSRETLRDCTQAILNFHANQKSAG